MTHAHDPPRERMETSAQKVTEVQGQLPASGPRRRVRRSAADGSGLDARALAVDSPRTRLSRRLAKLSNRDKHRTIVEVTPTLSIKVNFGQVYADPLGDPDYVGYAVEEPQIKCRLIPAEHDGEGDERVEAIEALSSILQGSADLLNHFLAEEGLDLLVITPAVEP